MRTGLAIAAALACVSCAPPRPPDVVFVLLDTLRADHLEVYGYGAATAPNLARLAARGVVYERVVAPSSWTKTSMASIWTARNALRHGVLRKQSVLPGELTTLAEALSSRGYHTIGVNTNPWLRPKYGFAKGFAEYDTLRVRRGFVDATEVTDKAVAQMRAAPADRPVFLYVHYMDVHPPYAVSTDPPLGPPVDVPGHGPLPDNRLEYLYRKDGIEGPGVQERLLALYDDGIREADAAVGNLLARLDGLDRDRERWLIVTSDHGEAFREHGVTEHGRNIYPEVYDVPLIWVGPDAMVAGTRVQGRVRSIDIAPSLLAWLGGELPESFDGLPLPTSPAAEGRLGISSVGFNGYAPDRHYVAVVSDTHLFVRERTADRAEFYDLRADPMALVDLGAAHPDAGRYAEIERRYELRETAGRELEPETVEALESLGYLE